MRLLCLGTGAADWDPARRVPGAEWRHFCSTLVDDTLLIDPGPHVLEAVAELGDPARLDGVTDLLVTHSHGDHYCPATVAKLAEGAARAGVRLRLSGSPACMQKLRAHFPAEAEALELREVLPFDRFVLGRYQILALPSNHSTEVADEKTMNYLIFDGDKRLLYALDGAWLLRESWNAIRREGVLDAALLDATIGDQKDDFRIFEHNSLAMIEQMVATMRRVGALRPGAGRVYADHMARTLHTDQETLTRRLAPSEITPCFDGMQIEI